MNIEARSGARARRFGWWERDARRLLALHPPASPSHEMCVLEAAAVMRCAVQALQRVGIEAHGLSLDAGDALMLAEAINSAAKTHDERLYAHKAPCVRAALALGAEGGWSIDGDCYVLHVESVGAAGFHDPHGAIAALGCQGQWRRPWCGVRRQRYAVQALGSPGLRRALALATGLRPSITAEQLQRIARGLARTRARSAARQTAPARTMAPGLGSLRATRRARAAGAASDSRTCPT